MAASTRSDRFIPFTKTDVTEMCMKDAQLTESEANGFRDFCRILEALFHYEFHARLEKLKTCYGPFNPDADTRRARADSPSFRAIARVRSHDRERRRSDRTCFFFVFGYRTASLGKQFILVAALWSIHLNIGLADHSFFVNAS